MRAEGLSFPAIAKKLGDVTPTSLSLWLKPVGPNGISEQNARKVAKARGLPDGFWRNAQSPASVTKSATERERVRWVAAQLGFHDEDLWKLWRQSAVQEVSDLGEYDLKGLPEHVWSAAMATVHLEQVTIEQAVGAAVKAWEEEREVGGPLAEHWLKPIAKHLAGKRRSSESGSRPRLRLPPSEPPKKK